MRSRSLACGVLVLVLTAALAGAAPGGKGKAGEQGTWKVTVTPDAAAAAKEEKEFDDTLILHKGKFRSTACDAYGFGEAPYRVEGSHWMSDAESKKEGKNHWHGEVEGDTVTGQLTWTKTDGSVMNYTFTGTRAGEQAQTRESKEPKK